MVKMRDKTFRRRYSLEYIIMLEVMRRFTDIYEDIYPNAPYAPPTLIEFEVHRDVKTGKPMLGILLKMACLLAALTRTIIETTLSVFDSHDELMKKLEQRVRNMPQMRALFIKKCQNCGHANVQEDQHCEKCGNELEDD